MIAKSPLILWVMVLYMALCLLLGVLAWRRTRSAGDFLLGGRTLGSWVTALSAQASDMSGWLLMGLPGLAYASGLDAAWVALGLALGTYLNWRFVAWPLRRETERHADALTLPDYFERRFDDRSRALRTLSAGLVLVFFTFYTSSGFVASGKLFGLLFDMGYVEAVAWGSAVMLAYTLLGGFLAISYTDVLQGTLMFFALVLVAVLAVSAAGGVAGVTAAASARDVTLLDPFAGDTGRRLGLIGVISLLSWGLGYPGQPHILARFMAARSEREISIARRIAVAWVVVVLPAAVVVGLAGIAALEQELKGPESEQVFVLLSGDLLHPALAGASMAAIMAAVMSTASAQLLVASSAFAEDVYRGFVRREAGDRERLWASRASVAAISAIAFVLALDPESSVFGLVAWAWAGFGAAFGPPLVLCLYDARTTRNGVLAGMLVGGVTVALWPLLPPSLSRIYEMLPGVVLASGTTYGVSRWLR